MPKRVKVFGPATPEEIAAAYHQCTSPHDYSEIGLISSDIKSNDYCERIGYPDLQILLRLTVPPFLPRLSLTNFRE
ncbi:hypothetical protein IH992_32955 [Candidatus Poribacteria bacterium]|nr:hypothetical protein [Candidatus Poribacteria bacterium]